jgi:predicted DNA binding CopG/RHH family protein
MKKDFDRQESPLTDKNYSKSLIENTQLTPVQKRLLQTIENFSKLMTITDNETEYFETCQDLVKAVANLTIEANFAKFSENGINYGQQALELAIESLGDDLGHGQFLRYDN